MRAWRDRSEGRVGFVDVVRDYQDDVWLLCCRLIDRQSADDLTQETFLRVYKALPGFRGEASLRTWVLSIARRVCADEVRDLTRERRRMARVWQLSAHAVADAVPDVGESVTLWASLACLDFDRRTAFVLTQIFGMSYQQAAQACDCPVGTIRSRVARARSELIEAQGLRTSAVRVAGAGGAQLPG